jgi:hypothetical protein
VAFMDAELERLQQQINDSVIEARQRARSLRAAVKDLATRLQAAGLEQERQLLLMAPSVDALERAALLLSRREQELQRQQGTQAMHEALADLGISATSRHLQAEVPDPSRERIEQLLVQLELLDDGSVTTDLRARLDALDGELDPRQRRLRLGSLALQISQALQRGNEAAERFTSLDDLGA